MALPTFVLNIASAVANNGQFAWTLPNTIAPGSNYLVQVDSDQYAGLAHNSPQPFTIPAPSTSITSMTGPRIPAT